MQSVKRVLGRLPRRMYVYDSIGGDSCHYRGMFYILLIPPGDAHMLEQGFENSLLRQGTDSRGGLSCPAPQFQLHTIV